MFTKTLETLKIYLTNLSDNHYYVRLRIINDNSKPKHSLKGVFDAIFPFLKTGITLRRENYSKKTKFSKKFT